MPNAVPDRSQRTREAFRDSVHQFVETVERVPPDAWEEPGLGVWTVRELVAHVVRIVDRTAVYAGQEAPVDTESAAAYYLRALSTLGGSAMVAERARQSVGLLGDDPAAAARAIGERTLAAIDALDDDVSVASPFGTLRLVDYLPMRILELVLHTLDIGRAVGVRVTPSPSAARITLGLLGELALERGEGPAVLLALSGREALREGYSVLGQRHLRRETAPPT